MRISGESFLAALGYYPKRREGKMSANSTLTAKLIGFQGAVIIMVALALALSWECRASGAIATFLLVLPVALTVAWQGTKRLISPLIESESRLANFLDWMPVGVFVLDGEGKPYYANYAAEKMLGQGIIPSANVDSLNQVYQAYLKGGEKLYPSDRMPLVRALRGECTMVDDMEIHRPNDTFPVEVYGMPIYDSDGKVAYAIATFNNITKRKQAEKLLAESYRTLALQVADRTWELSETLDRLQATQKQLVESEKMAALGELVAGISHEINTPVGNSLMAASTLSESSQEFSEIYLGGNMKRSDLEDFLETAIESSDLIFKNLKRAAELIKSFKQVAVDQSSEHKRTFKLKAYLEEIKISLTPKFKRNSHKLEIRGDENLTLDTYPGALSQIVTNLILNSLLHAYSQNEAGCLTFDFYRQESQIILLYRDDGCGMPPENLGKIFDPFFTTKRSEGGSGLGMHIVYNLVTQKLGGTIECRSKLGTGTRFIIVLPAS